MARVDHWVTSCAMLLILPAPFIDRCAPIGDLGALPAITARVVGVSSTHRLVRAAGCFRRSRKPAPDRCDGMHSIPRAGSQGLALAAWRRRAAAASLPGPKRDGHGAAGMLLEVSLNGEKHGSLCNSKSKSPIPASRICKQVTGTKPDFGNNREGRKSRRRGRLGAETSGDLEFPPEQRRSGTAHANTNAIKIRLRPRAARSSCGEEYKCRKTKRRLAAPSGPSS